jgi:hypothetical protein
MIYFVLREVRGQGPWQLLRGNAGLTRVARAAATVPAEPALALGHLLGALCLDGQEGELPLSAGPRQEGLVGQRVGGGLLGRIVLWHDGSTRPRVCGARACGPSSRWMRCCWACAWPTTYSWAGAARRLPRRRAWWIIWTPSSSPAPSSPPSSPATCPSTSSASAPCKVSARADAVGPGLALSQAADVIVCGVWLVTCCQGGSGGGRGSCRRRLGRVWVAWVVAARGRMTWRVRRRCTGT